MCCGGATETGVLCRACARRIAPCDGLIRDHIRGRQAAGRTGAWLVDGFGVAHALAERTTVGRGDDCGVMVLAASVSREHAELKRVEDRWHVRDLGSRNGTLVDGTRSQGRVALRTPAVIKFGDVAMWFVSDVPAITTVDASHATASGEDAIARFRIDVGATQVCVVGRADPTTGGALLARPAGATGWVEQALPPLEFHLLRTLCTRACAESDLPSTARGCVATKQLARELPFQSRYANDENVRQVVRRLRIALDVAGADGLLAVVPGRGYYLTRAVTVEHSGH